MKAATIRGTTGESSTQNSNTPLPCTIFFSKKPKDQSSKAKADNGLENTDGPNVDKANFKVSYENVILSQYEFYEFTISTLSLLVHKTTHDALIKFRISVENYQENGASPEGPELFKSLNLLKFDSITTQTLYAKYKFNKITPANTLLLQNKLCPNTTAIPA
jgi:hypothetical protein